MLNSKILFQGKCTWTVLSDQLSQIREQHKKFQDYLYGHIKNLT